jgi:hypothetical protein
VSFETQHFSIRNAPKGEVIAIWRKEREDHLLIFGVKDTVIIEADCNDQDLKHHGDDRSDPAVIEGYLMNLINKSEFSVMSEIAQIPHIISDGVLHHLGILTWQHEWHAFVDGWHRIVKRGTVYAKVIEIPEPDDTLELLEET